MGLMDEGKLGPHTTPQPTLAFVRYTENYLYGCYNIPVLSKITLILANLVSGKANPDVAVLDEVKCRPCAKAQESARRVDGEAAAHMRQEESTLTERAFNIN